MQILIEKLGQSHFSLRLIRFAHNDSIPLTLSHEGRGRLIRFAHNDGPHIGVKSGVKRAILSTNGVESRPLRHSNQFEPLYLSSNKARPWVFLCARY